MAEFSASDAAIEGVSLARRRPGAVLAWSLAHLLFSLVSGAAMVVLVGPQMQAISQFDPAMLNDPIQVALYQARLVRVYGLLSVINLPWVAVMTCAVLRALLRPADGGFAYIRFGADELRMLGLLVLTYLFSIAVLIAALVADFILIAIVGVMLGLLGYAAPAGGMDPVGSFLKLFSLAIPLMVLSWVLVRISLAGPMTFVERRLCLLQSWKLTRGRAWALSGAYFISSTLAAVTWLVGLALAVLVGGLVTGQGFVPVWQGYWHSDYSSFQAWFTVSNLVMLALTSVYSGLLTAIFYAPAAAAYRMLAGAPEPAAAAEPARQPTGPWG